MEETAGIAPLPSEATTSTANSNPLSSESINYPPSSQSHMEIYSNTPEHVETVDLPSGDRSIPLPELKALLRQQLEYYFSKENLSTDSYLHSQMDEDKYVPIITIAKFNQIRRLTQDINLVVEVLRESTIVQVDEAGQKVRPNPRSGVLILREIPETTPLKDFEDLFNSENCPKFIQCEFAHNNSWYVLFDTDEDTQKAYRYLREEAKTFNGKPIMARIKAKAITSAPFTPQYKNGMNNTQEAESYNSQNVNHQQQPPVQYAYTNVPNEGYSNQQVITPPFYPPTMLQAWAPTTPQCVDLGTVLSVNGLSPQAAYRPLNNNTNRHNFSSRERPIKTFTPQNYNFSRSEQNRYFSSRGQSTSYLQRQQLHQQPSFTNIVNTNSCSFEYMPYTSRSRNLNFGVDMNFFTAPNLFYSKVPSLYPTHASQTRHNPVLMPRNQVGLGAINNPDQSYIGVGNSTVLPFPKDSVLNTTSTSKQNADSQAKENWGPNQRQRKRWSKENGTSSNSKNISENSNGLYNNKPLNEAEPKPDSPKFDLETSSFPPLPGCMDSDINDVDVYASRLSDVVKGTVKPATRDSKTQTSESALICTTKDSSTLTIEETTLVTSDGAFTPPMSPIMIKETISTEPVVDASTSCNDWDEFESSNDVTLCNDSISAIETIPDIPIAMNTNISTFHPVSSNSIMNGSLASTSTEAIATNPIIPEPEINANVPNEAIENRQTSLKMPKAKPLDLMPKTRCDLPSPKSKTPEATAKNKFDAFKDRSSLIPKNKSAFQNNKMLESSSSKEKVNDILLVNAKTLENNIVKNSEVFSAKEKAQGHAKNRSLDSTPRIRNPDIETRIRNPDIETRARNPDTEARARNLDMETRARNSDTETRARNADTETALVSVNGHVDSESTVSSEDEKAATRKLTYSEVAIRAKEKVEKIAAEIKQKERQEAMVRHHRQQEIVAQNRQAATRGPFREFPRNRAIEARSSSREWRERRRSSRTIPLSTAGQ